MSEGNGESNRVSMAGLLHIVIRKQKVGQEMSRGRFSRCLAQNGVFLQTSSKCGSVAKVGDLKNCRVGNLPES